MKKAISFLLAITMLFTLAVTGLAAGKVSIQYVEGSEVVIPIPGDDGYELRMKDAVVTDENGQTLEAKVAEIGGTDYTVVELDIYDTMTEDEANDEYFADGKTLDVTINIPNVGNLIGVLRHVDKLWEDVSFEKTGENTIVAHFTHLCEVAFVYKDTTTDNPGKDEPDSPQTGYSGALWVGVGCAAALAVAGVCFANAKKKSKAAK